jgi:hypothetical protein
MFGEVFTPDERADLLTWIQAWEAENPDVTAAERVTGWIDVAYAFQERGVSVPSWRPSKPAPGSVEVPAT